MGIIKTITVGGTQYELQPKINEEAYVSGGKIQSPIQFDADKGLSFALTTGTAVWSYKMTPYGENAVVRGLALDDNGALGLRIKARNGWYGNEEDANVANLTFDIYGRLGLSVGTATGLKTDSYGNLTLNLGSGLIFDDNQRLMLDTAYIATQLGITV